MVANREAIVLDSANNVFVGPNSYFKIVIDSFDGTAVQAWHVEDPKGNKTGNLAGSARGRNIDLLLTRSNRTVAHFIGRLTNRFLGRARPLRPRSSSSRRTWKRSPPSGTPPSRPRPSRSPHSSRMEPANNAS